MDYQVYPIAEFNNKVSLELQSGGTIDTFSGFANFSTVLNTDMAYDITDLLEENCPDALELIPEDWWGCLSRDGRIYGLPAFFAECHVCQSGMEARSLREEVASALMM